MPSEDQKITPIRKPEEAADANGEFARLLAESERSLAEGELIRGRVIQVTNDEILVDIGYKSEGMIPRSRVRSRLPDRLPRGRTGDRRDRRPARGRLGLRRPLPREGPPHPGLGRHRDRLQGEPPREGEGPRARQGRPLRRHRRPGVPARLARRHPAAEEPRRPAGPRARVPHRQLRQEARQHRPLAQGAHGRGRRGEEAGSRRRPSPTAARSTASSRTSPSTAPSSTSAASTASST